MIHSERMSLVWHFFVFSLFSQPIKLLTPSWQRDHLMGRERTNKKVESVVGYIEHKTICATMLQQIKNNFFCVQINTKHVFLLLFLSMYIVFSFFCISALFSDKSHDVCVCLGVCGECRLTLKKKVSKYWMTAGAAIQPWQTPRRGDKRG